MDAVVTETIVRVANISARKSLKINCDATASSESKTSRYMKRGTSHVKRSFRRKERVRSPVGFPSNGETMEGSVSDYGPEGGASSAEEERIGAADDDVSSGNVRRRSSSEPTSPARASSRNSSFAALDAWKLFEIPDSETSSSIGVVGSGRNVRDLTSRLDDVVDSRKNPTSTFLADPSSSSRPETSDRSKSDSEKRSIDNKTINEKTFVQNLARETGNSRNRAKPFGPRPLPAPKPKALRGSTFFVDRSKLKNFKFVQENSLGQCEPHVDPKYRADAESTEFVSESSNCEKRKKSKSVSSFYSENDSSSSSGDKFLGSNRAGDELLIDSLTNNNNNNNEKLFKHIVEENHDNSSCREGLKSEMFDKDFVQDNSVVDDDENWIDEDEDESIKNVKKLQKKKSHRTNVMRRNSSLRKMTVVHPSVRSHVTSKSLDVQIPPAQSKASSSIIYQNTSKGVLQGHAMLDRCIPPSKDRDVDEDGYEIVPNSPEREKECTGEFAEDAAAIDGEKDGSIRYEERETCKSSSIGDVSEAARDVSRRNVSEASTKDDAGTAAALVPKSCKRSQGDFSVTAAATTSPMPAPRRSSKGQIDATKLSRLVLSPECTPMPGIGRQTPDPLPRPPPPRVATSKTVRHQPASTTTAPLLLPRSASSAAASPDVQLPNRTRRQMPPPIPETSSVDQRSEGPSTYERSAEGGNLDAPVLPPRILGTRTSTAFDGIPATPPPAHGLPKTPSSTAGLTTHYETRRVRVDSENPGRNRSKSSMTKQPSQSMNDIYRRSERADSVLSLHVPVPSSDDLDDRPLSPSHSESCIHQIVSEGYLPMDSQRSSMASSRFSTTSRDSIYVNPTSDDDPPVIPPRLPSHGVASSSTPSVDKKPDLLGKVVLRDTSFMEKSHEDDGDKYSYLSLYDDDEPLYQIYHQGAVVRNVLEQNIENEDCDSYYSPHEYVEHVKTCVNDILKRDSGGSGGETIKNEKAIKGISSLEIAARSGTRFRKLWCEMPKVKESGLLDHMTPEERRLQESLFEILSSEASYLKSLNMLVDHFMSTLAIDLENKDKIPIMTKQDFIWLFSNAKAVRDACIKTLEALEEHWQLGCVLNPINICQAITHVVQQHYHVYITYCSNASYQERKLKELMEKSPEFRYTVRHLEDLVECHSLPLSSFLTLPMQRITRLPLLITSMCRFLKSDDLRQTPQVMRCIHALQKIVKQCNEGARKMSNLEQMTDLEKILDFRSVKKVPLISQSRYLVKKGFLVHIINQPSGFLKKSKRTLFFFLFNDLLVITKKKNDKHYEVLEHCPRSHIHAEVVTDDDVQKSLPYGTPSGCKNLFSLAIVDKGVEFVLSCDSQSEQMRWIQAVTPVEEDDGQGVIYVDWDCPQVQAVAQYISKEPDELSLEESDIVNVLRKMNDGWFQGERIRDGERGWFPSNHTVEIHNAHVRARNLRQQYQLMKKSVNTLSIIG